MKKSILKYYLFTKSELYYGCFEFDIGEQE